MVILTSDDVDPVTPHLTIVPSKAVVVVKFDTNGDTESFIKWNSIPGGQVVPNTGKVSPPGLDVVRTMANLDSHPGTQTSHL